MSLTPALTSFRASLLSTVQQMIASALGSIRAPVRICDISFVLGGIGTPLAVGDHVFLRLGLNGPANILTWSMAATVNGSSVPGSIALDVLVGSTMSALVSLCGGSQPALSGAAELADQLPTPVWTTQIPDPSWAMVTVLSTDNVLEVVNLTLRVAVGTQIGSSVVIQDNSTNSVLVDSNGNTIVSQ